MESAPHLFCIDKKFAFQNNIDIANQNNTLAQNSACQICYSDSEFESCLQWWITPYLHCYEINKIFNDCNLGT